MNLFYEADLQRLDKHFQYKRRRNTNTVIRLFLMIAILIAVISALRTIQHQKADT